MMRDGYAWIGVDHAAAAVVPFALPAIVVRPIYRGAGILRGLVSQDSQGAGTVSVSLYDATIARIVAFPGDTQPYPQYGTPLFVAPGDQQFVPSPCGYGPVTGLALPFHNGLVIMCQGAVQAWSTVIFEPTYSA